MDEQRKDQTDPKGPKQRNCPKQQQTYNLPTENNSTKNEEDLLLANKLWILPWGAERMPQRIQRHNRMVLHRSAPPKLEQDNSEKSNYVLD